jgi:HEPN superfamily Apea-like protein
VDSRFPASTTGSIASRRETYVGYMPLPLREFADRFGDVVTRWIGLYQELPLVLDVFFSAHSRRGYVEHQFFSIAQAVEAYHRLRIRQHELSEKEHTTRHDAILALCPAQHRDWLKKKLQHSNELSLRQRLRELLTESPMKAYIAPNQKQAIQEIWRYRNAIAHGSGDTRPKIGGRYGLLHLRAILSLLMQERLLHELGFPISQAASLLQSTWQFGYAMRESER